MKTSETTQSKVTIPSEVADYLDGYLETMGADWVLRSRYIAGQAGSDHVLDDIPFDTLLSALVNGYERELKEEEARELAYEELREIYANPPLSDYGRGFDSGLLFTLDTLGIVIPGINDAEGADASC